MIITSTAILPEDRAGDRFEEFVDDAERPARRPGAEQIADAAEHDDQRKLSTM